MPEVTPAVIAMTLDPAMRELAACTAGISDVHINTPEFRGALSEVAGHKGVAVRSTAELVAIIGLLRSEMGLCDTPNREPAR